MKTTAFPHSIVIAEFAVTRVLLAKWFAFVMSIRFKQP